MVMMMLIRIRMIIMITIKILIMITMINMILIMIMWVMILTFRMNTPSHFGVENDKSMNIAANNNIVSCERKGLKLAKSLLCSPWHNPTTNFSDAFIVVYTLRQEMHGFYFQLIFFALRSLSSYLVRDPHASACRCGVIMSLCLSFFVN